MTTLLQYFIKNRPFFISKTRIFFQNPLHVFISLSIVGGLLMVFLMPIFMNPDEQGHLERAYQITEGRLLSDTKGTLAGGKEPSAITKGIGELFLQPNNRAIAKNQYIKTIFSRINDNTQSFVNFSDQSVYSPINYIPQSIGVLIAKLIYPSLGTMVFLGRLFNLMSYIFMVGVAIKTVKKGKWVYVVIALFPMAIQQAASLSGDTTTIGLALIWIALLQNIFFESNQLTKKKMTFAIVLAGLLAITKQTNIILLLPILFVPRNRFSSGREKFKFVTVLSIVALCCWIAWFSLLVLSGNHLQFNSSPLINQHTQEKWIIDHPMGYIKVLYHTLIYSGFNLPSIPEDIAHSIYGSFSFLYYSSPVFIIILGYILLTLSLLFKEKDEALIIENDGVRILSTVSIITIALSVLAIATIEYLTWTPVGQSQIAGIQGRYFIDLIPLIIPLFVIIKQKYAAFSLQKSEYMGVLTMFISLLGIFSMIYETYKWFY